MIRFICLSLIAGLLLVNTAFAQSSEQEEIGKHGEESPFMRIEASIGYNENVRCKVDVFLLDYLSAYLSSSTLMLATLTFKGGVNAHLRFENKELVFSIGGGVVKEFGYALFGNCDDWDEPCYIPDYAPTVSGEVGALYHFDSVAVGASIGLDYRFWYATEASDRDLLVHEPLVFTGNGIVAWDF